MINRPDTRSQRIKRHKRVRAKISGTPERPRLNVFRSETNIYAQTVADLDLLIAHHNQGRELGHAAALDGLGHAVEVHNLLHVLFGFSFKTSH